MARNENEQRTIALKFITNATQTKAEVDNLMNSLDSTSDEFQELQQRSASLESAIRDLNNVMNSSTGSSNILNTSINKLDGEINRADDSIKRLNTTSKQNISTTDKQAVSTKGLTKEVTENGGAMAILDTITGGWATTVKDAIEATTLFTAGTNLSTIAQRAYTFVVGTSTGALKAFRIALAATGIGAAVVLIGFLVEAYMRLTSATDEATESQRRLNAEMANNQYEETISRLEFLAEVRKEQAREQGASINEIRELERQSANEKLKELDKRRRDERLTSEQVEKAGEAYLQQQRKIVLQEARWRADDAEATRTSAKQNADIRVKSTIDANKRIVEANKKMQDELNKIIQSADIGSSFLSMATRLSEVSQFLEQVNTNLFQQIFNSIDPNQMVDTIVTSVAQISNILVDFEKQIDSLEKSGDIALRNRFAIQYRIFDEFRIELVGIYRELVDTAKAESNNFLEEAFISLTTGMTSGENSEAEIIERFKNFIIDNKTIIESEFGDIESFIQSVSKNINNFVTRELGSKIEGVDIVQIANDIESNLNKAGKSAEDFLKSADKLLTFMNKFKTEVGFSSLNSPKGTTVLNNIFGTESDARTYIENMSNMNQLLIDSLEQSALLELESLNGTEQQKQDIRDYYAKLRIEKDEETINALNEIDNLRTDQQLQALDAYGNLLGATSGLMEEHTAGHKILAVAQTTIDTYTSAMSAYKGMVQAIPGPVGIKAGIAAAAASVITGISNVKKILAVKVPGGGGTGGGAPSASAGATPNVSFVSSSENQIANSVAGAINNNNQEPIKAYVVASDVSTGISLEMNKINSNSL